MKLLFYNTKNYEKKVFDKLNTKHQFVYIDQELTLETSSLANGYDGVVIFVNAQADAQVLTKLKNQGVKYIFLRCMGYDKVDLKIAKQLDIKVFRVKNYSAQTVAEHALSLLMAVNRNLKIVNKRVENYNFSLDDLEAKSMERAIVGVIGGGQIGQSFIKIVKSMNAKVLLFDPYLEKNKPEISKELGITFVPKEELFKNSDIISLHTPYNEFTHHIINKESINLMKDDVILINTSRGGLIDTSALVNALKNNKFFGIGLDVLEREQNRFFLDCSSKKEEMKKNDPEWDHLINNDKVVITSHQAFLTDYALNQIASKTLNNIDAAN
ncbi:MAG: 2-hydroxyacid dehydrogenase, partial [Mycoplasma sp.]|nr:2-hydroxyacid dehydrogenase [Mycoplasma sp.]